MLSNTLSLKQNIDSLFAALVAASLIYCLASIHGIGISPDSVTYTSVAKNMQYGKFWYKFDNMPLVVFPIFYPSFLGAVMFVTKHDIVALAPVLNAILFGTVIFFSGCILQQFKQSAKLYKWVILSCLIASSSLIEIYSMLWSETLFILLLLILMVALRKYATAYHFKKLVTVAIICAIACVTRFAGIAYVAIVGFIILVDNGLVWRKKWWHLLSFGAISVSLLAINLGYNYYLLGTLTGNRQKSITSLRQNLQFYGNVMWDWLKLPEGQYTYATWLGICLLVVMMTLVIKRCWQQKNLYTYQNIAAVAFIMYVAFIIATACISKYEQINNRLLSAAFIPLLLGATYWLPNIIKQSSSKIVKGALVTIFLTVAVLFQYNQYIWANAWYGMVAEYGLPGYTDITWQQSPMVIYLQQHKTSFKVATPIYSNANDAVYFFSGMPCQTIPEVVHDEEIICYFKEQPHYIVWFTNEFDNPNILRLQEVQKHHTLDTLQRFSDGYILYSK